MKQVLSLYYAMVLANVDSFQLSHPSTIYTNDDVNVLTGDTAEAIEGKLVNATITGIPALPDVGKEVVKDNLYLYNGTVYRCEQSHIRMNYTPDQTLALFTVFRKETTGMAWIVGEKVTLGAKRVYGSKEYKCIQPHLTQSDYTPELTIGVLWILSQNENISVFVHPTGAQDVYMKGTKVYFPTVNDSIYMSLIDNNSWSPTEYPQGWQKQ